MKNLKLHENFYRNEKITNKEDLLIEVYKLIKDYCNKDYKDKRCLSNREGSVLTALNSLDLKEDWKSKNIELFAELVNLSDNSFLIELLYNKFKLEKINNKDLLEKGGLIKDLLENYRFGKN